MPGSASGQPLGRPPQQRALPPKMPSQRLRQTWLECQKCALSSQTCAPSCGQSANHRPVWFPLCFLGGNKGNVLGRLWGCIGESKRGQCPPHLEAPALTGRAPWACPALSSYSFPSWWLGPRGAGFLGVSGTRVPMWVFVKVASGFLFTQSSRIYGAPATCQELREALLTDTKGAQLDSKSTWKKVKIIQPCSDLGKAWALNPSDLNSHPSPSPSPGLCFHPHEAGFAARWAHSRALSLPAPSPTSLHTISGEERASV